MKFPFWLIPIIATTIIIVAFNKKEGEESSKKVRMIQLIIGILALLVGIVLMISL